jgi:hypothetical protein
MALVPNVEISHTIEVGPLQSQFNVACIKHVCALYVSLQPEIKCHYPVIASILFKNSRTTFNLGLSYQQVENKERSPLTITHPAEA